MLRRINMSRMKTALKTSFNYAALLSAILTAAGCASPGWSKITQARQAGKPVSLAIIYVTTASAPASFGDASQRLNDAIISRLNESEMFTIVTNQPPDPSLGQGIKLAAEIKQLTQVSEAARDWAGVLAGRAGISIQTTVTDLQSGRLIQSFDVVAESDRTAYGETTGAVIERAAKEVARGVLKLNSQSAEGEAL